jgi:hypothetical protein
MDQRELIADRIFDGRYVAHMNKLYHQIMSWRYGVLDRTIRVLVGILAIGSFTASLLAYPNAPFPIGAANALLLSFASMSAAIVLNVVPVGDFYKRSNESYRSWTTHSSRWENLENRFYTTTSPDLAEFLREVNELTTEKNHVESSESAAWPRLLARCQEKANATFFGDDVPSQRRKSKPGEGGVS